MSQKVTILGIESSCDDTAAAVVVGMPGNADILSSVVEGQTRLHAPFGGVVPEIAARAHAEKLDGVVKQALKQAGASLSDLDAIAVTAGPGLIGGLLSGIMFAKAVCAARSIPLLGVNHLAGHALTPRLTHRLQYPYLTLIASGGHCQFVITHASDHFTRLGGTIDDAPGEAFDKVARMLGLPQPGGPAVEAEAAQGDAARFALPRPLLDRPGCDVSFAGLKTAVLRARDILATRQGGLFRQDRADLCAGFQAAVCDVLEARCHNALCRYLESGPPVPALAVAGGVAANTPLRARLQAQAAANDCTFVAPPIELCTDNGAMIAFLGIERYAAGHRNGRDLIARARWPLAKASDCA